MSFNYHQNEDAEKIRPAQVPPGIPDLTTAERSSSISRPGNLSLAGCPFEADRGKEPAILIGVFFFFFLIKFVGLTWFHKTIQVSTVQLNKSSSAHCTVRP